MAYENEDIKTAEAVLEYETASLIMVQIPTPLKTDPLLENYFASLLKTSDKFLQCNKVVSGQVFRIILEELGHEI